MPRALPTLASGALVSLAIHFAQPAHAGYVFTFSDPSGLGAEAEFTLLNPTTLQIRLQNTSTGVPLGFDASDQILTGLSWDFGHPGFNGDVTITSGSVFTSGSSMSVNFDVANVGANQDVSGEWGFGNMDGTGALTNFISANTSQATPFGGLNLDATVNIDGPQGGIVADPALVGLGGLGAIQDEIIATLILSGPYTDAQLLFDLLTNGTRVEFGSDAAFLPGELVPAPGALALLAIAGAFGRRRRRPLA